LTTIEAWRRLAGAGLTACALALSAPAQSAVRSPAEGRWMTDAKGCKLEGEPDLPRASVRWSGACRQGHAEGQGEMQLLADGVLVLSYKGGMSRGRFSGPGVLQVQNENRYEGDFVDGLMQGAGRVTHADGTTGSGNFVSEKLSGACMFPWVSGDRYDGQCTNGWPCRSGRIQFANGDAYDGAIANGQASGQGRYHWADGDVYEGGLIGAELSGHGSYRFADGSLYVGKFRNGVPWGQGRIERADGLTFEGEFAAGKPATPGGLIVGGRAPASGPSAALSEQLQLRYRKLQRLKPSWAFSRVESMCPGRPAPFAPTASWAGRAVFRAMVIVRQGQVSTVRVQPRQPAADESLNQQMAVNVEKALRAYQCTGDGPFEQDFEFASGN